MNQFTKDYEEFDRQVANLVLRTEALTKDAKSQKVPVITIEEALEELQNTVEELQVAQEELRAQSLEIELSRSVIDTERRRYLELFDFAPDAYLETSGDGAIYEANLAAEALVMAPSRFLKGKPLTVFVQASELPEFRNFLTDMKKSPERREFDFRLVSRDNVTTPVTAAVAPAHNSGGQPVSLLWLLRRRDGDRRTS